MIRILATMFLLISGCSAQDPVFANCNVRVYKNNTAVVINPKECEDKQLVNYLNCSNQMIPINEKPGECR